MVEAKPQPIFGRWKTGIVLDLHTASSELVGYDDNGNPQFDTVRTPLGELMFQLKYRNQSSAVPEIAEAAQAAIAALNLTFDFVVPVPPSKARPYQPVHLLAQAIGNRLAVPVEAAVIKIKPTPELKSLSDLSQRSQVLALAFSVDAQRYREKVVLLIDDLYRSGETMNAVSSVLYDVAGVKEVHVLAITKTRSNR